MLQRARHLWNASRLRTKGLVVVSIPFLGLLLTALLFHLSQVWKVEADAWVQHSIQVNAKIEAISALVADTETGTRGYLLTHNPDWLAPYKSARRDLPETIAELQRLTRDNATQAARARQIQTLVSEKLDLQQQCLNKSAADRSRIPLELLEEGKLRMDRIRSILQSMLKTESEVLDGRRKLAAQADSLVAWAVLAGVFMGVLGGIAAAVLFSSGVANRVAIIGEQAEALAAGKIVVPRLHENDEISALEKRVSAASSLMLERDQQLRQANQLLEQRVQQRTADLILRTEELEHEAQERKRASEALQITEERFRSFMEYLPAVAFIKNSELRYIYGNSAWRAQFPQWENAEGHTDAELWPAETAATFAASDQRVLTERVAVQMVETGTTGPETRYWLVTKFPIAGPQGAVLIGGLSVDITENKRLQEQLYQAQKLEGIGLLAGGVAHDFNNLLTVILGYASNMAAELNEEDPLRAGLLEIQNAATQAAGLTSQLLAFGRKQVLHPKVLNLNAVLKDVQRMLRRVLREDVELRLTLSKELGSIKADPVQLQQVVMNLAWNAQDAMPHGGRLTIETDNAELSGEYGSSHWPVQPGLYVMMAVSDTGVGMDSATRAHIFEPFFTTKEQGKGTGLGLATVYGIVRQSGGYIWVYSEPGQGTTFKIYLPRIQDAASPHSDSGVDVCRWEKQGKTGQTVLVVEDEEAVRKLLTSVCTRAGYVVLQAKDGSEGLEVSEAHPGPIDLVITDVIMPGINGRVLAERISRKRPEARFLYCSGYAQDAAVQHGVLESSLSFLQKPFTPGALLQKVRAALKNDNG